MQDYSKKTTIKLIKILGKIIKKHRLEQDKTMYKISAECSIHKDSWRLIEKGLVNDIKLSSLWKIAEGLDIPPEALIAELRKELGDDFSISGLK